jgi:2-deoxy-D-gluconate 3-dehydrogenase
VSRHLAAVVGTRRGLQPARHPRQRHPPRPGRYPGTRQILEQERFAFIESIAKLGRVATPEDVVACALYLASDESSVVTGTEIVLGGGNILLGPQLEMLSGTAALEPGQRDGRPKP